MSYKVRTARKFEKSVAKCVKRGYDMSKLKEVVTILSETGTLPSIYNPHRLKGRYNGYWECHIGPDWLLIWDKDRFEVTLMLLDTGTHSDLF
jgi:mRNA interferase YafQ